MKDDDPLAAVTTADRAYWEAQRAANAAKERLFDAWATAVASGHSADVIATHVAREKDADEIEAGETFTVPYIRRRSRQRGAAPLKPGPKRDTGLPPATSTT